MKTFDDVVVGDKIHCIKSGVYKILPVIDVECGTVCDSFILDNGVDEPISIKGDKDDTNTNYYDINGEEVMFYISRNELMTKLKHSKAKADEKTQRYINKSKKLDNLLSQIKEF